MPHAGRDRARSIATRSRSPTGTVGPIAVSAAVYYQSVEAIVAGKFLGNMVDDNANFVLEPCVLGGLCDGRVPAHRAGRRRGRAAGPDDRAQLGDRRRRRARPTATPPRVAALPASRARATSTRTPSPRSRSPSRSAASTRAASRSPTRTGAPVPAAVDQIGPGTFGLFPHRVLLKPGATYTARLAAGVADAAGNGTTEDRTWTFTDRRRSRTRDRQHRRPRRRSSSRRSRSR